MITQLSLIQTGTKVAGQPQKVGTPYSEREPIMARIFAENHKEITLRIISTGEVITLGFRNSFMGNSPCYEGEITPSAARALYPFFADEYKFEVAFKAYINADGLFSVYSAVRKTPASKWQLREMRNVDNAAVEII